MSQYLEFYGSQFTSNHRIRGTKNISANSEAKDQTVYSQRRPYSHDTRIYEVQSEQSGKCNNMRTLIRVLAIHTCEKSSSPVERRSNQ